MRTYIDKDEECVLEEVNVITKDCAEIYDVEILKQLNFEVFGTLTRTKILNLDHLDPMKPISELHVAAESPSRILLAGCPSSLILSEGLVAALEATLLHEDQTLLTEDLEEEQDVQRAWNDFLEGLSFS